MTTALTTLPRSIPSPTTSLDAYFAALGNIPVLTREQEQVLAKRWYNDQDTEAAQTLVVSHLRFVAYIAKGYQGYGLPLADLIQEGNIGLMRAVKKFNPNENVRLVTYAVHWIRSEMHEYVIRNWRQVKIATTKAQRKLFFNLRKMRDKLGWLNVAEREQIAKDLNVKPSDVLEMEKRLSGSDVSFDRSASDDDEKAYAPVDYLPSLVISPEQALESSDWQQHQHTALFDALTTLDKRSQHIIQKRYLDENKETLQDLADSYGVSAERIRQIESAALKKLKEAMVDDTEAF